MFCIFQAQKEKVNVIQEDVDAQALFQSKMVLHISKGGRGHG